MVKLRHTPQSPPRLLFAIENQQTARRCRHLCHLKESPACGGAPAASGKSCLIRGMMILGPKASLRLAWARSPTPVCKGRASGTSYEASRMSQALAQPSWALGRPSQEVGARDLPRLVCIGALGGSKALAREAVAALNWWRRCRHSPSRAAYINSSSERAGRILVLVTR